MCARLLVGRDVSGPPRVIPSGSPEVLPLSSAEKGRQKSAESRKDEQKIIK